MNDIFQNVGIKTYTTKPTLPLKLRGFSCLSTVLHFNSFVHSEPHFFNVVTSRSVLIGAAGNCCVSILCCSVLRWSFFCFLSVWKPSQILSDSLAVCYPPGDWLMLIQSLIGTNTAHSRSIHLTFPTACNKALVLMDLLVVFFPHCRDFRRSSNAKGHQNALFFYSPLIPLCLICCSVVRKL